MGGEGRGTRGAGERVAIEGWGIWRIRVQFQDTHKWRERLCVALKSGFV